MTQPAAVTIAQRSGHWLVYASVVILGIVSFLATRGTDGEFLLLCQGFIVVGLLFVVAMLLTRDRLDRAFLFQSFLLLVTAIIPMGINNQLEEMGGMMNLFIPAGALLIVITAGFALIMKARWKSK